MQRDCDLSRFAFVRKKMKTNMTKEQFKAAREYWSKKEQIKMPEEQYGRCAGGNPQL